MQTASLLTSRSLIFSPSLGWRSFKELQSLVHLVHLAPNRTNFTFPASLIVFQLISFRLSTEASDCPWACFSINVSSGFGLNKEKPATCSSSESLNQYFTCRSHFPLSWPVLSSSLHLQLQLFQTLGGDQHWSVAAVLSAAQRDSQRVIWHTTSTSEDINVTAAAALSSSTCLAVKSSVRPSVRPLTPSSVCVTMKGTFYSMHKNLNLILFRMTLRYVL